MQYLVEAVAPPGVTVYVKEKTTGVMEKARATRYTLDEAVKIASEWEKGGNATDIVVIPDR